MVALPWIGRNSPSHWISLRGSLMGKAKFRAAAMCLYSSAVAVAILCATPAAAEMPQTVEERRAVIQSLNWQRGGTFHLDGSKTTLTVAGKYVVVTGRDAPRYYETVEGTKAPHGLEVIVVDPAADAAVMFASIPEGYVRFDDWGDVDADRMLRQVKENTDEANKERIANHIPPVEVIGWRERPTLDRATQTVRWAIEARAGNDKIVNAVVLTFGRYGFEKLTWVGPAEQDSSAFLTEMRSASSFDPGARYVDFKDGDKVAAYTIATLVATVIGAKAAVKAGLFVALAVLLKKLWLIAIAAVAGIATYLRSFFGRRRAAARLPAPRALPDDGGDALAERLAKVLRRK